MGQMALPSSGRRANANDLQPKTSGDSDARVNCGVSHEMRHAWQKGSASRGVLFLLLAIVIVNAITACAAPVPAQPAHPC